MSELNSHFDIKIQESGESERWSLHAAVLFIYDSAQDLEQNSCGAVLICGGFMTKTVVLTAIAMLILVQTSTAQQGSSTISEDDKTRPDRTEIINSMVKSAGMSSQQQDSQLNRILKSESKTPRSDFLFCLGLAYRGVGKAQTCVAKAYETGSGVVEDQIEAYIWYALALENKSSAGSTEQSLESEEQRIKTKLQTAYPFPSDEDLENQLKTQHDRIAQYQSDFKKAKK
jgi:hypothetical protein